MGLALFDPTSDSLICSSVTIGAILVMDAVTVNSFVFSFACDPRDLPLMNIWSYFN